MRYFRLLDPAHRDTIIRAEGRIQHQYDSAQGWIRSGILLHYQWPDSDIYNQYEEISEADAIRLIGA